MQRGHWWTVGASLTLLALGAYSSFVLTRELTGDSESSANPAGHSQGNEAQAPATSIDYEAINANERKPRFQGELLGVYIAPYGADLPADVKAKQDAIRASGAPCTASRLDPSFEKAGSFNVSFSLPDEFVFDPAQSGVVVCNDTNEVGAAAHWMFKTQFNGYQGWVKVSRYFELAAYEASVATDKVSQSAVGGRAAVLIEALFPETGFAGSASVIFVEPSGSGATITAITGDNIPTERVVYIGEIVAQSLPSTSE
jgi:hypothetical protein